jgi:hypothetical protein
LNGIMAWENTLSGADLIDTQGWFIAPRSIEPDLLDRISAQFEPANVIRREIRARAGVEGDNEGTLHHLLGDHPCFVELLARLKQFDPFLRSFFGGNYILNSYGGVINNKATAAYIHNIHRDIRFASDGKRFMLNLLVMLDDFTVENGATYLLSGSHLLAARPDTSAFFAEASRATGPKGSILFFDSRLWHAAGTNSTALPRRALTLTLTSPFFKQQLDYPRLLGAESDAARDPFLRQLVGFNARVPSSLHEYYVPVAHRFYQRGQDE